MAAAVQLCDLDATCPGDGDCAQPHGSPGCNDPSCCQAVCATNVACCIVEWSAVCADLAAGCPGTKCSGTLVASIPPSGTIDARQPHDVNHTLPRLGLGTPDEPIIVIVSGGGLLDPTCFTLCETASDAMLGPNAIASIADQGDSQVAIILNHALTAGAATSLRFVGDGSSVTYFVHPANANGDGFANPVDILFLIDLLNGVQTAPFGLYSSDIDHSHVAGPSDILRAIDLLNGAGEFEVWNNTPRPQAGSCP